MRWYVAGVNAGQEATAEFNLRRQEFESFSPGYQEKVLSRGVLVKRRVRLYPGYIFVRLDLDDRREGWKSVNGTRGVTRLMPLHCERPSPLPRGFVEDMILAQADGRLDAHSADAMVLKYRKGEEVPVIAGAFAGFSGKLSMYKKGSLVLLLSLFGRETEVPIPSHQVAPKRRAEQSAVASAA